MNAAFPETIGKYKIIAVLAKGGMGTIYKALHPSLKREVVIKRLSIRGNPDIRERFKREAQILLDLHNPHIVHMFDYFTEGSYHYIVLEFVDGLSLDQLIKKQSRIPSPMALMILLDACYGLKYAHTKGIIHRDIKPGNILISKKGEVKLADFGIATTDKETEDNLTRSGTMLGTPSYMPPEQFSDSRNVDKRADIYSLGVMLYEMVTGTKPFPGGMTPDTMLQIRKGKYIPPSKIESRIPPVVRRLIRRMIRPSPSNRYQDVGQVIAIIKRYLSSYDTLPIREAMVRAIITPQYSFPAFSARRHTRKKLITAIAAAILIPIGGGILWATGLLHRSILKPWFAPLAITVRLPASAALPSDLNIVAQFFINDGDSIPPLPGSRRHFHPLHGNKTADKLYTISTIYVRPGNYRVKVTAGPYVWWESLIVGANGLNTEFDYSSFAHQRLTLRTSAADALTGRDISDKTEFSVWYGGQWVNLSRLPREQLVTGSVWRIRAQSAGYIPEIFSLRLDWYQDELFIRASLLPQ